MNENITALRSSSDRLRHLVDSLDDSELVVRAYPEKWTIADVLSHIGSGAVIMHRRLEDALADQPTPNDFTQGVWDEWNAKGPKSKAEDALTADASFVDRLESLSAEDQAKFKTSMGPMTLDFDANVGMRLNEHALHTWDVEVVKDPSAALPPDVAALVVDRLNLIARYTGKPTGSERTVIVHTTNPQRMFSITLSADTIVFAPGPKGSDAQPDLELPAEAFVRLIYGRLDAAHTPPFTGDAGLLDELRKAFPGP